MSDLPSSAKIVIIGGGIVGCSVAYHLGKMGLTDVLVLERGKLTCGSTWHAAGLVGQLRTSANITQLLGYSVELYDRLEQETGLATGWKRNGGLRLACNPERWTEVKRQATTATSFGLEMHLLDPKEAQALWPLMQVDDVVGAAFLPTDGQASPSDIAMSLAKGARNAGVKIFEGVAVTGVEVEDGRVRAVATDKGRITCDKLVICAGQWSREIGRMAGVNIPLVSVQHQYLITETIDGVTRDLPTLRDPDRLTYWKEEVGGLVMGGYEPNPKPWAVDGLPDRFEFQLLDDDLEHFEPLLELAVGRVPAMPRQASASSSMARRALRRMAISSSARRQRCGTSSSARASTPLASPRAAGPAWRLPNGWPRASRPTTSGRSTSAGSESIISTPAGCARGRSRLTPSTTPWPGRSRNIALGARSAGRRSTTG